MKTCSESMHPGLRSICCAALLSLALCACGDSSDEAPQEEMAEADAGPPARPQLEPDPPYENVANEFAQRNGPRPSGAEAANVDDSPGK